LRHTISLAFLLSVSIHAQTTGRPQQGITLPSNPPQALTTPIWTSSLPSDLPADSEISCHADGATIKAKDGSTITGWRTRATMRRKDGTEWKKTFRFRTKMADATRDCELWVKMAANERTKQSKQ
jgi:hypothetical protein